MQINFDELMYPILEVGRFILHVESSPIDAFYIFEPFVADELVPHRQAHPCPRIRLEDAQSILLVFEY